MGNEQKKQPNINTLCIFISLLAIIIYIAIDGMGMIINSSGYISGRTPIENDLISNLQSTAYSNEIIRDMIEQYIARIIYLVIALFPVIFIPLRYHISFKSGKDSLIPRLLPYLRLAFGLMFFYYILTIGTVFSHEMFTDYYSFGYWPSFFRIIGAFAALGACMIDWPSFFASVKVFPSAHPWICKALFVIFISICSCMLVEFQVGSKMDMVSSMLVFSILYWIILQVFIDVISRSVKIGAFVSIILSYLIGLINDVVYQFRGNYVMYGDLTVVRTALEVAGNYTYKPGVWFWISLILLICASAMIIVLKFPKHDRPTVKEISIRAGVIVSLVICVLITFNNGLLYKNISGVGWDYNKNVIYAGYMPYFLSNMNSIKKVTVEGYEAQLADEAISTALDQMGSDDTGSCKHPNIIIIQNEAFADLSVAYDIETNRDYMPFIHSMNENTRKGYLNMSVTGGPTANTEFEILMRTTLNFLPYGSVPYTQYVDADLPSIAQVLKNQPLPYHTVAYHSYYSSGYRRISVYDHLGFDESYFEDKFRNEFPESDLIRSLMSDSANYRRVEEFYEDFRSSSDEPWFCFNVTIQNHGGYTVDYQPDEDDNIYVTNFDAPDSVNEYLSLVKVSDDAFRELIEYFEQCDEPTIIAMYGDHQPKMDHEANTVLDEHPSTIGNSRTNSYYVPYVIWANFDIEESDTLGSAHQDGELNTLSTNYFASTVFDIAGIQLTDYDRYLIDLHERIPAITAIGIWDSDGNYYSVANQTPYADELNGLEMVQYNLIFDDNNRLTDRFE